METTKYGWIICEWDNTVEKDSCEKCNTVPDQIYFRSDGGYDCREGRYWCIKCINKEEKEIDRELQ